MAVYKLHKNFEKVEEYGDTFTDKNGEVKHCLYTWDDGERYLIRCKKCGALFLVQKSEYHNMFDGDDDYYTDYFPVDSIEEAHTYNEQYDGTAIEKEYKGKWIRSSREGWHWN